MYNWDQLTVHLLKGFGLISESVEHLKSVLALTLALLHVQFFNCISFCWVFLLSSRRSVRLHNCAPSSLTGSLTLLRWLVGWLESVAHLDVDLGAVWLESFEITIEIYPLHRWSQHVCVGGGYLWKAKWIKIKERGGFIVRVCCLNRKCARSECTSHFFYSYHGPYINVSAWVVAVLRWHWPVGSQYTNRRLQQMQWSLTPRESKM